MKRQLIYTVGHSNHEADYFLSLLQTHNVNCVVDVRSIAASRFNPHYNKKNISDFLKTHKIEYLHFPEEFGAHQTDPTILDKNGKVDFEKIRSSVKFKNGINRLKQGTNIGYTIALMCSESDPLDCHRFAMISVALQQNGFEVKHILKNNSVISNAAAEQQLLKKYSKRLPDSGILTPDTCAADQLAIAYRMKNNDIGFAVQ